MRFQTFRMVASLLLLGYFFLFAKVALSQSPNGFIAGRFFIDFNQNGNIDHNETAGLQGVVINLYGCDAKNTMVLKATTTSKENGQYRFEGLEEYQLMRVEVVSLPAPYMLSKHGNDHQMAFRIVGAPNDNVHFGVNISANYCQPYPNIVASCYVTGNPIGGGSAGDADAFVDVPYLSRGRVSGDFMWNNAPRHIAYMKEIGSVWGVAYQKDIKRLFVASFLKRHVGFGQGGIGAIYMIDYSGNSPILSRNWIDLTKLGIDLGQNIDLKRDLQPELGSKSTDSETFGYTCKMGIGDIELSEDGRTLWVMNLYKKELVRIDLSEFLNTRSINSIRQSHVRTIQIPNSGCSRNDYQPFGLRAKEGKLYIGMTCTAETSQRQSELMATIYQFNPSDNSFYTALAFPLNYQRGFISKSNSGSNTWYPWRSEKNLFIKLANNLPFHDSWNTFYITYPQPVLSNLDFTEDGYLVMSLMDRFGHQTGYFDNGPDGITNGKTGIAGGDILIAAPIQNGSYLFTVENNGKVGKYEALTNTGDTEGIGGKEFFFDNTTPYHHETNHGSIAIPLGLREVVMSALDPDLRGDSGGFVWMRTDNGLQVSLNGRFGYELYYSREGNSPGSLGKAAGIGEIDILCDPAPMEIGGRLWYDDNNNGIQDPCEHGIQDIELVLMDASGNHIATTWSLPHGYYFFGKSGDEKQQWKKEGDKIKPNTNYVVLMKGRIDNSKGTIIRDSDNPYGVTKFKVREVIANDSNDSEAVRNANQNDGYPVIYCYTGASGVVNHNFSFGFAPLQKQNARVANQQEQILSEQDLNNQPQVIRVRLIDKQ
jgi:hypothetical protein